MEKTIENIVIWLRESAKNAGAKGLVFGLSGGIDSAVMAGISKIAFPDTSLGIIMPCHSIKEDEEDGRLVAESLDLKIKKVDLTKTYDSLVQAIGDSNSNNLALANIKPRLRMTTLYYYAQEHQLLVAGPTNKSEFVTGYFTKNGDSAVDILPLVDFTKDEIYEMARILEIPEKIINKTPSAGLWEGQSDEDEMGFTYKDIEDYIEGKNLEKEIKLKIDKLNKSSGHKRKYPPMYIRN